MGGRPPKVFKPLVGYDPDSNRGVRSIDLTKAVVKKAKLEKLWIFDPSVRRWWNPEEFMEMYERYDNIDPKWFENLQIRDPFEGLDAADVQIKDILDRKAILAKKIIDYWKGKVQLKP